jgi:transposase InsO family protein
MAFRHVAPQHGGAAPTSTRGLHAPPRSSRQVLQTDQGTTHRSKEVMSFFTDIINRFDIPNTIITDNETQFTGNKFLNFCDDNNLRVAWSAVAHPKTNRQVDRANGMILQGLKARIFKRLEKF